MFGSLVCLSNAGNLLWSCLHCGRDQSYRDQIAGDICDSIHSPVEKQAQRTSKRSTQTVSLGGPARITASGSTGKASRAPAPSKIISCWPGSSFGPFVQHQIVARMGPDLKAAAPHPTPALRSGCFPPFRYTCLKEILNEHCRSSISCQTLRMLGLINDSTTLQGINSLSCKYFINYFRSRLATKTEWLSGYSTQFESRLRPSNWPRLRFTNLPICDRSTD